MILDPILPEIYTFLDFARHDILTCRKKGLKSYTTHLGGEIAREHPMPYNVYVPVREYLDRTPQAIKETINYLNDELSKNSNNFTSVEVTSSKINVKKAFGRSRSYPQINVTVSWE